MKTQPNISRRSAFMNNSEFVNLRIWKIKKRVLDSVRKRLVHKFPDIIDGPQRDKKKVAQTYLSGACGDKKAFLDEINALA